MFGQLGTRGVSIIVSSGDFGPGMSCQSNDGAKDTKFIPSFPATCPYVTSVGSTEGIGPERAANFSAGGFSDYFARPEWQDEAVGGYLRLYGNEWKGFYNAAGRGFPDVAVQGVNYRFWNHGKRDLTSGTRYVLHTIRTLWKQIFEQADNCSVACLRPSSQRSSHCSMTIDPKAGCLAWDS